MTGKKLFHELRHGKVKATIWHDNHNGKLRFNVAFTRLCNDDDGRKWWGSAYFQREDLTSLVRLADDVFLWIGQQGQRKGEAEGDGDGGTS